MSVCILYSKLSIMYKTVTWRPDNWSATITRQYGQETQLSLTNRATRLEVSQGTIPYFRYDFLLSCYSNFVPKTNFEIFDFKNAVTLKTGLGDREVIDNVTIR